MANSINYYYDTINGFNLNCVTNNESFFRVAQWNIRGINDMNKFDEILFFLESVNVSIDVLVIGETWLKSDNCCLFQIPNYNSVFSCRDSSSGGLAVYIKSGLSYKVVKNVHINGMHLIHNEIKVNGSLYDVVGVYRPPSFDFTKFHDELESLLSTLGSRPFFVVGDVNVPINLTNNNVVVRYKSLLESYGCVCSNTCATRPASNNILDHFITRREELSCLRNDTIFSEVSDHLIVVSSVKIVNPRECIVLTKRIVDKTKLNDLFTNFLNNFTCCQDVNESIETLVSTYQNLSEQCTKLVRENVNVKGQICPWLNLYVWKWIKLKGKYLKKVKNDPNNDRLKEMFKYISKKTDIAKRSCKSQYYENILSNTCHAKQWKHLNELMGRNPKPVKIELYYGGRKTSNNREICEIFNDYFANIGENLASTIQKRNTNPVGTVNRLEHSIFLNPANVSEVISIINELDVKKSCGPDNFSPNIIKSNADTFSVLLSQLFNQILSQGKYPDCLKVARVSPIFKSGDATDPCNYRPISTLSVFSKIFEKLLVNRIVNFLNKYNVLYKYQYGFRKGCSTATAIVELVDFLLDNIDKKCIVGGLFIDLKKAFDTLNHDILLKKLESYGIRGLANEIFRSYLSDRKQFVALKDDFSSTRLINIGVPQGSNVGPLLFLLYINDLGNLPLKGIPKLFADDTALFYPDSNVSSIIEAINYDLRLLMNYFETNLLSLNLLKTKYMLFHSPRKKMFSHANPTISSVEIEEVSSYKYLGLIFDPILSWKEHIRKIQKKVSSLCGLMYRVRQFVPRKALLNYYYACVHSHLQYLIIVWGHASQSNLQKLQVLQNRCLKIIYKLPRLYSTGQLYENSSHSILPLRGLCRLQTCLFVFDMLKNSKAHCNLVFPTGNHMYNTRQANNLLRSRASTCLGQMRITSYGPSVYNVLPNYLKALNSRLPFKTRLKQHFKSKISEFL